MQVLFTTKYQSKQQQFKRFLTLNKAHRVQYCIRLMDKSAQLFGTKLVNRHNFVISLPIAIKWEENINTFIALAQKHRVRMIMVGGGAVNFHGYQRHSSDVGFWIDTLPENLNKLILVLNEMGYKISCFPEEVQQGKQNISLKFSPYDLEVELITRFAIGKSFEQAYNESEVAVIKGKEILKWRVLSFNDLIISKMKSGRAIDKLDIEQLQKIKQNRKK